MWVYIYNNIVLFCVCVLTGRIFGREESLAPFFPFFPFPPLAAAPPAFFLSLPPVYTQRQNNATPT